MRQPQFIEVDPQRIRFNADNPRQHGGMEFALLKNSVREVGLVQFPSVRVLQGGGLYEAIDGEGRVRAAQEERLPKIWAISFGVVDDKEALTMLQAANTVRNFSYIAQCRGFAKLNRQGKTVEEISRQFGGTSKPSRILIDMVAMGNLPDDVLDMILEDMARSTERENLWTSAALTREILTLRQVVPGKHVSGRENGEEWKGSFGATEQRDTYDYSEVRRMVEQIIHEDDFVITVVITKIVQHRNDLFQERFNQELQEKLTEEIAKTRTTLEEMATSKVHDAVEQVEEETRKAYEDCVASLQKQLEDTHKRYDKIVKEVAKRPEAVERLENELREKITALDKERAGLLEARLKLQQEADRARQQAIEKALAEVRKQAEAELAQQKMQLQRQYDQAEADLREYWENKTEEMRLRNEKTVQQLVAKCMELMSQTQQQVTLLTSSGMIKGMNLLEPQERTNLVGQIGFLRQVLERAEEKLEHGETVVESHHGREVIYDR